MYITKHVSAFILCFPERFEFALDVFFTDRFVLVDLYNQRNKCCRQFAHIHIDVKFFKEAKSDLIFSVKSVKSCQKRRFIEAYRNSGKLDLFQKINFFTILDRLLLKNKVRFGFLEKFYVDMYISELCTAFISWVLGSYKHEPVCEKHIQRKLVTLWKE